MGVIIRQKQQQVCHILLIPAVALFFLFLGGSSVASNNTDDPLAHLIKNGGYLVGSEDRESAFHENKRFLPASTLKILTTLAAFELLGPEFRFETHLYLDSKNNLYIKGLGDPFLTSEEILRLCSSLHHSGVITIQKVFFDFSAFALMNETPGSLGSSNPYDAPNGALAVNFNSLAIQKLPGGAVISAEPQTPTLPIMQRIPKDLIKDLAPGKRRININVIETTAGYSAPEQYTGELFSAQLKKAGITVKLGFEKKPVPTHLSPFLRYKNSKTLEEMMRECLRYSNNFVANQVFLYCGAKQSDFPASWQKSRQFISNYLITQLDLSPQQFAVYDGAGLSRKNRITARGLVTILRRFSSYKNLLNRKDGALLKSGTLRGVYCYAGYLIENEPYIPFVILLNQKQNTRDKLLQGIQQLYTP